MTMSIDTVADIKEIFRDHVSGPMGKYRFYSVLVPFIEHDGEVFLLLEKRARDLDANPGEICFPGGMMEPGETPEEAAVRECGEELGIPAGSIEITGRGNELRSAFGFSIYTVMAEVPYEAYLRVDPSPDEVQQAFLLPLKYFLENRPDVYMIRLDADASDFPLERVASDREYRWYKGEYPVPIYDIDIPGGGVLWGMTARMIDDLSEIIRTHSEKKSGREQ